MIVVMLNYDFIKVKPVIKKETENNSILISDNTVWNYYTFYEKLELTETIYKGSSKSYRFRNKKLTQAHLCKAIISDNPEKSKRSFDGCYIHRMEYNSMDIKKMTADIETWYEIYDTKLVDNLVVFSIKQTIKPKNIRR